MFTLTATELTSARILRDFSGELMRITVESGERIAYIRFPDLMFAARHVDICGIESYASMQAPPYRFNERVTVRFCYSAYQRDADAHNLYDSYSHLTRSQQYTKAMIHRRYAETRQA